MKQLVISILSLIFLSSCISGQMLESRYINDPEMSMGSGSGESFNQHVFSIREGALPVGGKKGSGGCGCN